MEASNEIEPHIDDESDDETPPEVLLAQERARLAQLREQRDELERKVAAAAAADAESYAASAAALRENVASIQVAADPAAAARLALKTKRATLREQSKELDRWKDLVAANRTGDVEALAALADVEWQIRLLEPPIHRWHVDLLRRSSQWFAVPRCWWLSRAS